MNNQIVEGIHKDCATRNITYNLLSVSPVNHGKNLAKIEFHPKGISKISIVSSSHFSKGLKYSTKALASIFLLPVISSRTSGHGLERPACNNFLINLMGRKVNPQSLLMIIAIKPNVRYLLIANTLIWPQQRL